MHSQTPISHSDARDSLSLWTSSLMKRDVSRQSVSLIKGRLWSRQTDEDSRKAQGQVPSLFKCALIHLHSVFAHNRVSWMGVCGWERLVKSTLEQRDMSIKLRLISSLILKRKQSRLCLHSESASGSESESENLGEMHVVAWDHSLFSCMSDNFRWRSTLENCWIGSIEYTLIK